MRQEVRLTESFGKTLEGFESQNYGGQAVLTFTDGTFATLIACRGFHAGDEEIEEGELSLLDFGDEKLISVGITTVEELKVIRDDLVAKQKAAQEKSDRLEFERLKSKLGA